MTAPPSATINPAFPTPTSPVSLAIATPNAELLLVVNALLLPPVVVALALAVPLSLPLVLLTGHDSVHGIAVVNGKLATELADAKAGT